MYIRLQFDDKVRLITYFVLRFSDGFLVKIFGSIHKLGLMIMIDPYEDYVSFKFHGIDIIDILFYHMEVPP